MLTTVKPRWLYFLNFGKEYGKNELKGLICQNPIKIYITFCRMYKRLPKSEPHLLHFTVSGMFGFTVRPSFRSALTIINVIYEQLWSSWLFTFSLLNLSWCTNRDWISQLIGYRVTMGEGIYRDFGLLLPSKKPLIWLCFLF